MSRGWETVIGLEVHCQLGTETKLFCGCASRFGDRPNTHTCPVCTGQPGALPVLNERAVALALRAALAVDGQVAPVSVFARKNYFYCDLPKGYQISQYDRPYCEGGSIQLASGKAIRLERIHIEEDAGKAIHDRGSTTLVDLNRAGIPLIESVTHPDISSADEAVEYLTRLKEIFEFADVGDCDMEKGSLRCDVNISVRRPGEPLRTKVELKNLNSFRNVKAAIEYEESRQVLAYESGDESAYPVQETRLFDAERGVTRTMRTKEDEHDYRYFPDPDLPPLVIDDALLERCRAEVPELPEARRRRYRTEHGLSEYDAEILTGDPELSDFFEATVALGAAPKQVANWMQGEVLRALGSEEFEAGTLAELPLAPAALADLVRLIESGTVHKSGGRKAVRWMMQTGRSAADAVRELGLEQVTDTGQLDTWCREVIAQNEAAVADIRAGKDKAVGALVGAVMKASKGAANPKLVGDALRRLIAESNE